MLNIVPYYSEILLLDIYLIIETYVHMKTYTKMFIVPLVIKPKSKKNSSSKCNVIYPYNEILFENQNNELLIHVKT